MTAKKFANRWGTMALGLWEKRSTIKWIGVDRKKFASRWRTMALGIFELKGPKLLNSAVHSTCMIT